MFSPARFTCWLYGHANIAFFSDLIGYFVKIPHFYYDIKTILYYIISTLLSIYEIIKKVRAVGLEPTRISPADFKSTKAANYITLVW